jgi:hypothetical protein
MRICKCGDYFLWVLVHIFLRNLQFMTKCEKRNPKPFFSSQQSNKHFLYWAWKNGNSTKVSVQNWHTSNKIHHKWWLQYFFSLPCFLPSLCTPWVSSHQLVLLTYSLGSKVERTKISYEWWGWFLRDTHVVVVLRVSMSSNAMECVRV